MTRIALFTAAAFAGLSLACAAPAAVFSENFQAEPALAPTPSLAQFNILGSVDVVAASNPYGITTLTGKVVDLDGSGTGEIVSKDGFSFDANQFVDLSFLVGGAQRGSLSDNFFTRLIFSSPTGVSGFGGTGLFATASCVDPCTMTGTYTASANVLGASGFAPSSLFFTSTTAGEIHFAFGTTSNDYVGPLLDNVKLGITGVPEPGAWSLMILGFGAAGAMLRRRRMAVTA